MSFTPILFRVNKRLIMIRLVLFALFGLCLIVGVAFAQDTCPPGKVTNVQVGQGKTTITVEWTFSGDDCNTGTATTYQVLRSTSSFDEGTWADASVSVVASGTPGSPGTGTCVPFEGLTCNTDYYWAVLMIDDAGNKTLSNVVHKGTKPCNAIDEVSC
jgi:hypothetical protein